MGLGARLLYMHSPIGVKLVGMFLYYCQHIFAQENNKCFRIAKMSRNEVRLYEWASQIASHKPPHDPSFQPILPFFEKLIYKQSS